MRNTIFAAAAVLLALAIIFNFFPAEWQTAAQSRGGGAKDFPFDGRDLEAAFTSGNLVVYRVGDGVAALGSPATAVFLDEYTPVGTLVQSIAMPTTVSGANKRLTASGTATSEGFIGRSNDGQYLVFSGYDADLATASITTSTSAAVNRVIGRIGSSGAVDTTTALTDAISGGNPRGVATTNGTDLWISGTSTGGGIRYATLGATTSVSLGGTPTNLRVPGIFDGQLYVSTSSGSAVRLGTVGTGTPTTAGQTITNLPGFPNATTAPYQFFFADLTGAVPGVDTVYVSEDAAAPNGGVIKYSLVGGNWVSNGLIVLANTRGLTGAISGSNVTLFATGNGTSLQTVTDATGYNVAPTATFSSIAMAGSNTAFRGVAFAPQSAGGNPGTLAFNPASYSPNESAGTVTFTVKRTGGTDGAVGINYSTSSSAFSAKESSEGDPPNPPATGGADCNQPGVDYITTSGTLNFAAGDDTETFAVTICNDAVFEPTEGFVATLSNPTGGAALGAQSTAGIAISDNDASPGSLAFSPLGQGVDEGAGTVTFTVSRTGGTDGPVSVNYNAPASSFTLLSTEGESVPATGGASCVAGVDFVSASGTLTFVNGDDTETFTVTICDDAVFEVPNEIIFVSLSNPTGGAVIGNPSAGATILNNDAAPPASIGGRVVDASGRGIAKTRVELYSNGAPFEGAGVLVGVANTSTFGYFGFSSLPTGVTYTVVVGAKRSTFTPNSQTFQLNSDNFGVNFTANP